MILLRQYVVTMDVIDGVIYDQTSIIERRSASQASGPSVLFLTLSCAEMRSC